MCTITKEFISKATHPHPCPLPSRERGLTNPVISSLTCDAHNMPFLKAFRGLSCGFTYDLLSKNRPSLEGRG